MALELIDVEWAADGALNEYYYDDEKNSLIVNTKFDATKLLDYTKSLRNNGHNGFTKSRDMRHIGEIPTTEYLRILKDNNISPGHPDEMKLIKQWLRRPENAYFRTVDKI